MGLWNAPVYPSREWDQPKLRNRVNLIYVNVDNLCNLIVNDCSCLLNEQAYLRICWAS